MNTDEDGDNNSSLETLTLVREDGSTFTITQQTNGDYCYRDDDGVGYTGIMVMRVIQMSMGILIGL